MRVMASSRSARPDGRALSTRAGAATARVSIHPIGEGASVGDEVAKALEVIQASGLEHELGPSGTTLLGEYDEVMLVVRRCHEVVGEGGKRVNSVLKIDWKPGLEPGDVAGKVESVEDRLADQA